MKDKVIIIGGGISGLSSGWKLSEAGYDVDILEMQDKLGGVSSTFKYKDYMLDYGPHKFYTQLPSVLEEFKKLIKDDLLEVPKKSRIRLMGKYFNYPIDMKALLLKINPVIGAKMGISYFNAGIKKKSKDEKTYEDYLVNRFGWQIYKIVFESYANKVWGDPRELSAELAKIRVAAPNLMEMIKNIILGNKNKPEISADFFYYPKKGIIELSNKISENIIKNKGKIRLNSKVVGFNIDNNLVKSVVYEEGNRKKILKGKYFISTMPIDLLPDMLGAPQNVISAANSLKYRSLILLYVVVNKDRVSDDCWIFFPEKEFIFNRTFEQKAFSEFMVPEGKTVLCVEVTCSEKNDIWGWNKDQIYKRVILDLERSELVVNEDILDYFVVKIKNVYPVYDLDYNRNLEIVLEFLDKFENLITNGRKGLYNYNNMDHCMDMGFVVAKSIIDGWSRDEFKDKRKRFSKYKIVD